MRFCPRSIRLALGSSSGSFLAAFSAFALCCLRCEFSFCVVLSLLFVYSGPFVCLSSFVGSFCVRDFVSFVPVLYCFCVLVGSFLRSLPRSHLRFPLATGSPGGRISSPSVCSFVFSSGWFIEPLSAVAWMPSLFRSLGFFSFGLFFICVWPSGSLSLLFRPSPWLRAPLFWRGVLGYVCSPFPLVPSSWSPLLLSPGLFFRFLTRVFCPVTVVPAGSAVPCSTC